MSLNERSEFQGNAVEGGRTRARRLLVAFGAFALCAAAPLANSPLPRGFVYLSDVAPTIVQDVRYAGAHNLVGRPLPGYLAPTCILTQSAALALAKVQTELVAAGLTLRVYDCYQPRRAVAALLAWSKVAADQRMKAEFYPRVEKAQLFAQGYLSPAPPSVHGSGVSLTVQRLGIASPRPWVAGEHSCIAPFVERYHDGSIDMGTTYDCMDRLSRTTTQIGAIADTHRAMLAGVMAKYGFKPAGEVWWSFVLVSQPFPKTSFDFPITAK